MRVFGQGVRVVVAKMRVRRKKCVEGEVGARVQIFISHDEAEEGWARVPFGGEKQLNVSPTVNNCSPTMSE